MPCQVQLAVDEEFNVMNAFNPRNTSNLLKLFEGQGAWVKQNNYGLFTEMFQGAFFVVASNYLPPHSDRMTHPTLFNNVWRPMMTRVQRVEFTQGHKTGVFPYEAEHLAGALDALAAERAARITLEAAEYLEST